MRILLATFVLLMSGIFQSQAAPIPPNPRCAVLLHGLARKASSMAKIEEALLNQGYVVRNESYPSRQQSIQELAVEVQKGLAFCQRHRSSYVYFATHSLGGILVRQYFQDKRNPQVRAVVMIAPPNKGSEVAEHFREASWFKKVSGIPGQQLGTSKESVPNSLKSISLPIGIIAGTESSDPWFSYLFDGANDGKVSVESTKLVEMRDFIEVPAGHTLIMRKPEVVAEVLHFFEHQRFSRKSSF